MSSIPRIAIAILAACCISTAHANQWDWLFSGKLSHDKLRDTRQAAEAGDAAAMMKLSRHYVAIEDQTTARHWLLQAAEGGHPRAAWQLCNAATSGDPGKLDLHLAATWYKKLAERGDPVAMRNLGILAYHHPVFGGAPTAVEWFTKAADAGDVESMCNLGDIFIEGLKGILRDETKAIDFYLQAAERKSIRAYWALSGAYDQGIGVDQNKAKSTDYMRLAAEAGDPSAMYSYSYRLLSGDGVEKNQAERQAWLEKAARQGDDMALYDRGRQLIAEGDPKNRRDGVRMLERAVLTGGRGGDKALNDLVRYQAIPTRNANEIRTPHFRDNSDLKEYMTRNWRDYSELLLARAFFGQPRSFDEEVCARLGRR